jgi:hypothetical protein
LVGSIGALYADWAREAQSQRNKVLKANQVADGIQYKTVWTFIMSISRLTLELPPHGAVSGDSFSGQER